MELIRDFQRAWVCLSAQCGAPDALPIKNSLVTNLSVSGAQLRGNAPKGNNEYVITIDLVPGTTLSLRAKNMWIKDDHFGLKFVSPTKRDLFLLRALVWAHRREDQEDGNSPKPVSD